MDWQAQGRLHHLDPVAVVDIGSNSVRLVIYEGSARSPTPLFNEKVLCALGRRLATTGHLGVRAMERALAALTRFTKIAAHTGASSLHVIATAAVRDAENGPDFIREAEKICGVGIDVLSGEEEAELAAAGVVAGFHTPDGFAGDLGGGSLELVDVRGRSHAGAVTLPLGCLSLLDLSGGDLAAASELAIEKLLSVPWLGLGAGRPFYAIGGSWRTLAQLHMIECRYPLNMIHGYALDAGEAMKFLDAIVKRPGSPLLKSSAVPGERRDTLPYSAAVLRRLIELVQPGKLIFSGYGVREGLVYRLLPEREKLRDPLLAACEDFARLRSRSPEHARELCCWTDALAAEAGWKETPDERRLRHSACFLSDIGWRAHPDYRGEECLSQIAQSSFVGIDHPGRAFLALCVYYRHERALKGDLSPRLRKLVGRRQHERSRVIGAAVRAAHMLSAGLPGVISQTPISIEDERLICSLPPQLAALDGERLRKRFRALANLLGYELEMRAAQKRDMTWSVLRSLTRRPSRDAAK
jgi:exopolyphosphatase/guanosine-5'-triphosphate,3'-diphosphate pyrophosphatase